MVCVSTYVALAQTGVSINSTGAAPDADAILDVTSTDKGVLLPRVTSGQRTSMSPTNASDFGMLVYDTDTDSFWYWDGGTWQEVPNVANTGNTLDEAYDEGGAGSGRTINADAGDVEIQGAGDLTVAANIGVGTTAPDRRMKVSGTGWTAIEVENTDNQDAAIELTSQAVSNYVFTDNTGFLGLESASGQGISLRTNGANERMVVQSDGRVRVNNLADPSGAVITSNTAGVLGKTPLTGDATDVLLGTGVFGSSSDFADHDWYQALSTNTPTGITDWIYTNGHVGIGTGAGTNPSAPLHVVASGAGNPASNSILAVNPTNNTGQDAIVTTRVAGASAGDPFFSMDISGEAGWSMGIDNDHDNRFKIAPSWSNLSSNTAMTIKTDGNVGIGTIDPVANLNVGDVSGPSIYLTREDNTTSINDVLGSILFDSTDDTAPSSNDASVGIRGVAAENHGNSNKGGHLTFFTKATGTTSGSSAAERMRIEADGNVGIGTTNPVSIFQVVTSQTGNASKLHNPTLANGSLVGHEFGKANSTNNMAEFRYNHVSDGNADNWINLGLWGNANTLNVVGTGNVGIGTTGPNQKLEVAGNTRITGLSGGGDRVVYANNNGDLYASTGIPSGDTDYIWNQNGSAQGANWRISGQGEANTLVANANGNWYLRGGDDHELRDVNEANSLGVWGRQNSAVARIKLGSGNNIIRSTDDQTGDYGGAAGFDFDSGTSPQGILIEGGDSESGGFFANGNTAAIWSPGDGTGGILSVYDEDAMDINNPSMRVNGSGVVEARRGMRSERQIRFYKRSRGNGQGGVDNLGNYDFCYLAGVAFRNTDSNIDEDDDYQCNVYTQDINGSAEYNEGENEDFSANFSYSTRPYWRMYSECYSDCSNSTCTAMCINFDF
jgi:hypothetical protein